MCVVNKWIIILVALVSVVGCNTREKAKEEKAAPSQAMIKAMAGTLAGTYLKETGQKAVTSH